MKLFTIGFTRKSAETFFTRLRAAGVKRLLDVRLNNVSQLAGFAKRDDLRFFVRELCGAEYRHCPELAPTQDMLGRYQEAGKSAAAWSAYERKFRKLIADRKIERAFPPGLLDGACLLCSEDRPHQCHRRLVAEYLQAKWKGIRIEHL